MSDDNAGRQGPPKEFRRKRSQPLPPDQRRSPRSGRVTVPPAAVRRRRTGLMVMGALSTLVLLASGTSWAITGWMSGALNRFDVFGALSEDGRPQSGSGGLTFLVIGSDARGEMSRENQDALSVGSAPGRRSDVIMLVRVNDDRDRVSVVGIPRDSWVDIPGEGEDKINAAYAYGGPTMTVRTVEALTDVRVDHYVEVDFEGFVDVVDALGGIEVCLPEAIDDPKAHLDMAAGTHEVDGAEALAFARTRATARGDLDRIDRQQQVLSAMLDRAMSTETLTDPARLAAFLESALSSVTVDEGLDGSSLNELAYQLRDLDLEEVTFTQVPIADMNHWTPRGDVALLWDEPAARDLFADVRADRPIREGEPSADASPEPPDPSDIRISVFNGTATPGLGARTDRNLGQVGFDVITPAANWDRRDLATTQIRHAPGDEAEAEFVSGVFPGSELVEDRALEDEVQVVLGFNYTTFNAPELPEPTPEETSAEDGPLATTTARENICG
ncbi:LCP family protein [Nocardiopsis sp. EMB25]|uniref:LCP family protein n=1 Tax=Nocardiopsis sp. EMB25 TaxID=2835867 RepID=UPI0022835495|nr:LCP family protein [Nocardiopsis sp. EMB25]MCY9785684.1 LCP family protein [Nocardiopsis sp. EMB25]